MNLTRSGPGLALAASALFGLSAPAAKVLAGTVDPWLLAGLLYLGSGVGLGLYRLARRLLGRVGSEAPLRRQDLPWLGGAIAVGGILGPVLLMYGLAAGTAVHSSLLLNLEGVFTALLAWSFFRESFDSRIAIGMAIIAGGAAILSWKPSEALALDGSALLVAGACLAWALDNNLRSRDWQPGRSMSCWPWAGRLPDPPPRQSSARASSASWATARASSCSSSPSGSRTIRLSRPAWLVGRGRPARRTCAG